MVAVRDKAVQVSGVSELIQITAKMTERGKISLKVALAVEIELFIPLSQMHLKKDRVMGIVCFVN